MTRRIGQILIAGIVAGLTLATVLAEDDLTAVEKKVLDAWQKHKSMTSTMKMAMQMKGPGGDAKGEGSGRYEVLQKGDKTLSRMEFSNQMTMQTGGQEMKMEQKMTSITDGEFTYTLVEQMDQKRATKTKVDMRGAADPKAMFETMHRDFELKLLPEETAENHKVYVIEATPKQKTQPQMAKVLFCFRDDGVLVKQSTLNEAGETIQSMTFSDFQFDVALDPQRFVFQAPEGVQVTDMTGSKP